MPQQLTRLPVGEVSGTARASISQSRASDEEWTYDELYEEARKRGLKGRSKMSKTELERALAL